MGMSNVRKQLQCSQPDLPVSARLRLALQKLTSPNTCKTAPKDHCQQAPSINEREARALFWVALDLKPTSSQVQLDLLMAI